MQFSAEELEHQLGSFPLGDILPVDEQPDGILGCVEVEIRVLFFPLLHERVRRQEMKCGGRKEPT